MKIIGIGRLAVAWPGETLANINYVSLRLKTAGIIEDQLTLLDDLESISPRLKLLRQGYGSPDIPKWIFPTSHKAIIVGKNGFRYMPFLRLDLQNPNIEMFPVDADEAGLGWAVGFLIKRRVPDDHR